MIFAVGKEINITFKTKIMILIIKLLRMRLDLYAFSNSRLEKGSFSWKKGWKKSLFLSKRGWNFIFVTAGHPVIGCLKQVFKFINF